MRTHPKGTTPLCDIEREPTPQVTTKDIGAERWTILHKGAFYRLNPRELTPIADREEIEQTLGLSADLIAEIELGKSYHLFIFDRGEDAQGVEEPLISRSKFTVSDRFIITTSSFLMHANIRSGLDQDIDSQKGVVELCAGSNAIFGRDYSLDGRIETEEIPEEVSAKHMSVAIDFDGQLYIGDNNSTNLTVVHHLHNNA